MRVEGTVENVEVGRGSSSRSAAVHVVTKSIPPRPPPRLETEVAPWRRPRPYPEREIVTDEDREIYDIAEQYVADAHSLRPRLYFTAEENPTSDPWRVCASTTDPVLQEYIRKASHAVRYFRKLEREFDDDTTDAVRWCDESRKVGYYQGVARAWARLVVRHQR